MSERPQTVRMPDPPRAVPPHLYARRARAMFFAGVMLLITGPVAAIAVFGATSAFGAGMSPIPDLLLNRRHSTGTATVIAKDVVTSVHEGSKHPWQIDFRFEAPGDTTVTTRGYTYDQNLADRLVKGDPIQIEYDPTDPSRARPLGGYARATAPWVALLLLGMFVTETLIGAALTTLSVLLARREHVLLTYGVSAEAEVLELRCIRSISFGSKHPYDIYYRFRDQNSAWIAGRRRTYCYAWAEALQPGDRVGVVFNPRNPQENTLWLHGKELERLGRAFNALR